MCYCIAELCTKIDAPALVSQLPLLLKSLLACCAGRAWTVRNAACVAFGQVVLAYPEQCQSQLDAIIAKLLKHLSDPISSVREDSAVALGQVSAVIATSE